MLDVMSAAIYAFGALTFSTLALFYWGERRRGTYRRNGVLQAFSVVCAIAFLGNLLSWEGHSVWLSAGLWAIRGLALGLLPPLMFHLVLETSGVPRAALWSRLLKAFYGVSLATAVGLILQGSGLLPTTWSVSLYRAPAVALAAASVFGLLFQIVSRGRVTASARAQRRWILALLSLMLICASASLSGAGAYVEQIPDYLLLALFGVSLFYRERLVFFDVLVKRGVFLALGLAVLIAALVFLQDLPNVWRFAFMLVWLAAPSIFTQVARIIDRFWLRRRYSTVEAEREFISQVQGSANEEDLRSRAAASLSAIFQTPAEVSLGAPSPPINALEQGCPREEIGRSEGFVRLPQRANGIPFLSDDLRLLRSLSAALAMVLENVRFRAERRRQEEREQQLRLLASRAELKALRAQINPHFLFNSLSVIAGLMQYQPGLADETIGHLAQVFRYALRRSETEWAPLGEEIEFITAYLRIEQARFGDRLHLEFDVDPAASRILIPAMSIQPLVENAIKHGVSAREGLGTVGLRAWLENGLLSVEVSDNGPGFPSGFSLRSPVGESHGLRNVAERLNGYYGDAATLSWESGERQTHITLTFPEQCAAAAGGPTR